MPRNVFDQACRYLAKLDPLGFLCWLLGVTANMLLFRGWLDTRRIPFPGERDRYCDTVAHLEDVQRGQLPWAMIVEFQLELDALMFGRFLAYGGQVWLELKPSEERGDRFQIGAIVVNLTGRGDAARIMDWPEAGMFTALRPREINLCDIDAGTTLNGILAGDIARVVLPLIPAMQGGCDSAIIPQWLAAASAEPDARRRSEYGGLAQVFAEAAGCPDLWTQALKGWNMIQSKVVLGWQADARADALIEVLETRFGPIPADLDTAIRAPRNLPLLKQWTVAAVTATTLADFRQMCQL